MHECPTREQLLKFARGELSDHGIENVGDHLEVCESCSHIIDELEQQTDRFIFDLRDAQISDDSVGKSRRENVIRAVAQLRQREINIRCPHCHHPIAVVEQQLQTEVTCPTCDSAFQLAEENTELSSVTSGTRLGRFELLQQVGSGAIGSVWKARDPQLDRMVAVKIPHQGLHGLAVCEQFGREARAAGQLRHPNIVSVHEVKTEGDAIYIVSDFIDGVTLADEINANRPSPREAAKLAATIAKALHHAHEAGIVHRDLKPSNIMLDNRGTPHIMDFGLAKREVGEITMTLEGRILGTPAYMSPEQARGEGHKADPRSDVYSLGVVLFELLTGERPFRGTARMLLQQVLDDDPPRLRQLDSAIPRDLETICLKCLEKDPEKRYPDAKSLDADLERFLRHEPIHARRSTWVHRAYRWTRRNPGLAALASTIALLLTLVSVISSLAYVRETAIREREQRQRHRAEESAAVSEARRLAQISEDAQGETRVLLAMKAVDATQSTLGFHLAPAEQALRDSLTEMSGTPFDTKNVFGLSPRGQWVYAGDPINIPDASSLIAVDHDGNQKHVFSPDGRWLAILKFLATGDPAACLFDLSSSARPVKAIVLPGCIGRISGAVFSPNSQWLAVQSEIEGQDRVLLWSLGSTPSFDVATQLEGTAFSFSLDGSGLVTVVETAEQCQLRAWDLTPSTPTLLSPPLQGVSGTIHRFILSMNSRRLFATSYRSDEQSVLQIWDLNDQDSSANPETIPHVANMVAGQDGKRLLAWTAEGDLFAWDLSEARQDARTSLTGLEAPLQKASFSSDGRWVLTSEYDGADQPRAKPKNYQQRLWHVGNFSYNLTPVLSMGRQPFRFTENASGRWFETVAEDGTVEIWDLDKIQEDDSPTRLTPPDGDRYLFHRTTISPDGRWMAAKTDDDLPLSISSRMPSSNTSRIVLEGTEQSKSYAFSPDGHWFVSGGRDGARLFSVPQVGERRQSLVGRVLARFRYKLDTVDFTADGKWLVVGNAVQTRLWSMKAIEYSLEPIRFRPPDTPTPTQFGDGQRLNDFINRRNPFMSPNGRWLVTGQMNFNLWDISGHDQRSAPYVLDGHQGYCPTIAFSPSSRWLATGSWDKTVHLWKLQGTQTDTTSIVLDAHEDVAYLVVFGPHDKNLITTTDRTVRLWRNPSDVDVPQPIVFDTGTDLVTCATISPDGRWLVTGHVEDGLPYRIWQHNEHDQTGIFSTKLRLWDLSSPQPQSTVQIVQDRADTWVTHIEFSPDSRWLITKTSARHHNRQTPGLFRPGEVRLWSMSERPQETGSVELISDEKTGGYTFASAFSPNGRWLAIGGGLSKQIQLWDLQHNPPVITQTFNAEIMAWERPSPLAFSHDSRFLFALGRSNVLRWEMQEAGHNSSPVEFGFASQQVGLGFMRVSPDNQWLFCSGLLWNLASPYHREPIRIADARADVAFSEDGKWIFTKEREQADVQGRRLSIAELMAMARDVAGRELTDREREVYFVED